MNHEEYERMYRFEDTYWWFVSRRRLIATLLGGYYPPDGRQRLLDIGCGTGAMLDVLAPFGAVIGADYAPQALDFCRARGAESGENYPLTRADVRCLPFADGSFDAVTAMDVIEHIDDDKAASAEIFRVLRPGGRLFVTVPAYTFLWSEHDEALHHHRRYTAPHLKDLFQRVGFQVPKLSYAVTSLFLAVAAYRLIAKALPKQPRPGGEKQADLVTFSPRVNTALQRLNDWETRLLRAGNLPFGVTVVCVAQKPLETKFVETKFVDGGEGLVSRPGRWLWRAAGAGALGALGYATVIEPYALRVVRLDLYAPRLPRAFDGYTVCQVSDLHMRQMGRRERSLRALMPTLPPVDLVAITGDMVHTEQGITPFLELAGSFAARDGLYAVFGNSEHKNGVRPHAFAEALARHNIPPLLNRHVFLERGGERIALAGVDDPVNDRDRLAAALGGIPDDMFTLLLMHSPDGIAEAVVRGVDVVLSGHTHGGQVRLPLFGAPHTHTLLGRRMSDGYYAGKRLRRAIGIRPGRTQLYVTRGLGVSGLALRFLAPPELTLLTLRRGVPGMNFVAVDTRSSLQSPCRI